MPAAISPPNTSPVPPPTATDEPRLATLPLRVTAPLLMLVGPAASAITGSLIVIDDGQSLPGGG